MHFELPRRNRRSISSGNRRRPGSQSGHGQSRLAGPCRNRIDRLTGTRRNISCAPPPTGWRPAATRWWGTFVPPAPIFPGARPALSCCRRLDQPSPGSARSTWPARTLSPMPSRDSACPHHAPTASIPGWPSGRRESFIRVTAGVLTDEVSFVARSIALAAGPVARDPHTLESRWA